MRSTFSLSKIFSEFQCSSRLALPLVAANVIIALNGFFATIMVSHLGKAALAANSLVWTIYVTVIVFFVGVLSAISIMMSQSFGASDDKSISICFKQGLIMTAISAVPMMLIMYFCPIILTWTGQDPEVINTARPLFHALISSMLPLNATIMIEQFFLGITKSRFVMIMSILQVPVEIFFYYVLVFGKFGFPELGLAGIGFGLALSNVVISLGFGCYIYFSKQFRKYNLFHKWWVVDHKFLFELFRVGMPLGFLYSIEVALFAAVAIMMGILGTNVLAAYQISYQYLMVPLFIVFAISQNATIRIGYEVGKNNRDALSLAMLVNMLLAIGLVLIFSVVYLNFPLLVIGLDINVHAANLSSVVNSATKFLAVVAVLIVTDCIRLIGLGALRGLKDTKFPVLVSFIGFWCIAFPLAYLLGLKLNFGGVGIWWSMVIGFFVAGIMLFVRFYRLVKRVDLVKLVTKAE